MKKASNALTEKDAYRDKLRESMSGVTDLLRGTSNKKQGWARDKYNAYQREYMKVLRAIKSGRAMLWK